MSAPVLTIPRETSLREAARLLARSRISGAPVVDREGRCVGVLSSSDFITWAGNGKEVTSFLAPWGEVITIEDGTSDNSVGQYLTPQPVAVAPTTPIGELAQNMIDAHIHRLLVIDEHNTPVGIVTSTDVLAAVARAARKAVLQKGRKP